MTEPAAHTAPPATAPIGLAALAALVGVTALWGFNFAIVKIGLETLPPLTFVFARFTLIAIILAPFLHWPDRRQWRHLLPLSVTLGVAHFGIMFTAMQHIDAATAAIAVQLQVPFAALLAAVFFRDMYGWRRTLGTVVAFAGIVVIAGEPRFEGGFGPLLLVILAACIWAFSNIQVKWLGEGITVWRLNGWVALLALPQLLALAWLTEGNPFPVLLDAGWVGWGAVLYQSIGVTVIGYGIWYTLMRRHAVNQIMPLTLLVPVFGVLSGIIVLGETLTLPTLIGGAATVAGVAIIVIRRPQLVSPKAGRV
ncbi:MAG: DMT family transporter [Dongiaceae bacterium]